MVNVLREAVLLEQLVGWVLKLWERLRRASDVSQYGGALGWACIGAERERVMGKSFDFEMYLVFLSSF